MEYSSINISSKSTPKKYFHIYIYNVTLFPGTLSEQKAAILLISLGFFPVHFHTLMSRRYEANVGDRASDRAS